MRVAQIGQNVPFHTRGRHAVVVREQIPAQREESLIRREQALRVREADAPPGRAQLMAQIREANETRLLDAAETIFAKRGFEPPPCMAS